eukprot:CAMPEP_0206231012 /NCGR_PEP_ID=MMETSP0047_2-20121206/10599_1 /ASSEMBLY_ACC=CAM_ASM_000192 /TAXON_ID=195065 /ORGANISM="Chroomonas mesostigmatica_cf, Strain CCMP1168" /LENGTH=426 /DNA_ID=CAMNT_0053654541 /DNA_START=88 /DNA_END=1368 /DNA_ORIENTATION=+
MGSDDGDDERQVQISFKTTLEEEMCVSSAPLVVPARLSRQGLSEVINHLLNLEKKRPFDFLVAGTLVRSPLTSLLSKKGMSLEEVIEVEYFLVSDEPKVGPETPHKDWVSAVCDAHGGHIASGCYDAAVRILPAGKGKGELELRGHTQPVTSVGIGGVDRCVSGSLDHSVRVWGLSKGALQGCARLLGHTAGVSSVGVQGDKIVSGSGDKTLKLWALPSLEELGGAAQGGAKKPSAKKAKTDEAAAEPAAVTRGCLATFVGHSQPVTGAAWGEDGQVWSGSWDHSVRCWDVETQQDIVTLSGGHAVSGLAASAGGAGGRLVASGHTDRAVRVWDPRTSQAALVAHSLHSHKGWVSAVAWSGRTEWELASASLDSTVKLWDIRASVPQHTIKAHEGKVLCVAFCSDAGGALQLVSGGEDGKLRAFGL